MMVCGDDVPAGLQEARGELHVLLCLPCCLLGVVEVSAAAELHDVYGVPLAFLPSGTCLVRADGGCARESGGEQQVGPHFVGKLALFLCEAGLVGRAQYRINAMDSRL
jgi:hypothetical protein